MFPTEKVNTKLADVYSHIYSQKAYLDIELLQLQKFHDDAYHGNAKNIGSKY